jgi:hypothetical protein
MYHPLARTIGLFTLAITPEEAWCRILYDLFRLLTQKTGTLCLSKISTQWL